MMKKITAVSETWDMTLSEHLIKTVTVLLDISLSAAFFAVKLIIYMTASIYSSLNELSDQSFTLRSQASWVQSTYDDKWSSIIAKDTRHLMLRLTRRICKEALILKSYTCMMKMTSLCSKHLRKMMFM